MSIFSPEMMIPDQIYYQTDTKNKSFLKMYKFLRDMGIKNNKFFLALYDKDLAKIDPLTIQRPDKWIKAKVLRECIVNPWYYLREICTIKVPGGTTRYILNRGNLALTYCVLNNIDTSLMMPRQNGKSIGAAAVFDWLLRFGATNSQILLFNKKQCDASLNLKRITEFIDPYIPYWLKDSASVEDKDNSEIFYLSKRGNEIQVMPSANSADVADKLGRGCTVPIFWGDEWAFTPYNKVIYNASTFAVSKAREVALEKGNPSFKILTTTPNSIDLPEGQYCKMMFDMAMPFDEKEIYDCPVDQLEQYVHDHSENNFVHIEFSWRQLGKDEKWYEEQKRLCNYDKLTIKREIDLEWTLSSDNSPFSEDELEQVRAYTVPAEKFIAFNSGFKGRKLFLLEPVDFYEPVMLSNDCSGGLGLDSSVMTIFSMVTGKPIGYFANNRIDVDEFGDYIEHVATKVFVNSCIVIERNSYGLAIIQKLAKKPSTRMRLFYEDKSKSKPGEGFKAISDNKQRVYGIDTTPKSRDVMIDMLFKIVNEHPEDVVLPNINKELKTMERKNTGKIEHAEGCHDDNVFSFLIGRYAMSCSTYNSFKNRIYMQKNNLVKDEEDDPTKIVVRASRSTEKRLDAAEISKSMSINKARSIFNLNR